MAIKRPGPNSARRDNLPITIHGGVGEKIFSVLPERVLANFEQPNSENALLWNLFYPKSTAPIELSSLLYLTPLWGTVEPEHDPDVLVPYFWGYNLDGEQLPCLDPSLDRHTTHGPPTEVDLYLLGSRNLILLEAKNLSTFGRCSRYANHRCPEFQLLESAEEQRCQYWDDPELRFRDHLVFEEAPFPGEIPACHRHYQLSRTLLVGLQLASCLQRTLWIWVIVPSNRWKTLQATWLDFSDRVRASSLWRRMRAISWETIQELG